MTLLAEIDSLGPVTLADEIEARSREIKTDGYSMSIGEVLSVYREGDLEVHPEFQRIFRWTVEQKSRLIESIMLGIPVPTIFVSQRPDGVWDVIDGVQRLSTILQFAGVYRDEDNQPVAPEPLVETEYLPSLDGILYEGDEPSTTFSEVQRRDFKRAKLEFQIIKKESDDDAKFDMFQRLNSGTELSAQEARNCLLVMLNRGMYEWIVGASKSPDFEKTVPLTTRKEDEGFRQELVLRFHLYRDYAGGTSELPHEFGEYLTSWMREVAVDGSFDRDEHGGTFDSAFNLINQALGDNAFRRFASDQDKFTGGFSISAYEAITSGLGANLAAWTARDPEDLRTRVQAMWQEPGFRDNSGTGVSGRRRMPRLVNFGRNYFA